MTALGNNMTNESPRRTSKFGGMIIKPQPVSDKSMMESVVDFFQDFTLSKAPEDKEKVCWVQFEQLQSNESLVSSNPKANIQNIKETSGPMMFLILGYMSGAQIWHVAQGNGETQEVLTLKKGPIRNLKFLISPISTTQNDLFSTKRPLIALTDFSGVDQAFTMLRILSLKYGEEVYSIPYQQPVLDILCNYRVVVIAFLQKLEVLDSRNFKPKFSISNCSLSPGINPNPVALSSRWLAYSDKNLSTTHQSGGGVAGEGIQSYTASIICAAKTIKEGITALGETLAGSMTSAQTSSTQKKVASTIQANQSFKKPGVVSIMDVMRTNESEMSVHDDWNGEGLVAHFIAHSSDPITSLTFDPSGTLLMTSDQQGRYFHLFKILIHPQRSSHSTVHHLYILHRGDTTAKIQSVAFTWDARWVAVSTVHGTTHVFPITSYGGPVNKRTHMSKKVVSRASRFHRSAGLEESFDRFKKSGRDSPAAGMAQGSNPGPCGTPSSFSTSTVGQQFSASPASPGHLNKEVHLINQLNNPRLPPYPHPTVVHPLAQIRQSCATIPGLDITTPITCSSRQQNKVPTPERRTVVACFSSSRVLPISTGSPCVSKERIAEKSPLESLFVATSSGTLTEYMLNVRPKGCHENVTDDSPIDVEALPKLQWLLARYPSASSYASDMYVPQSLSNPLLSSVLDKPFNPQKPLSSSRSRKSSTRSESSEVFDADDVFDEEWLSQVEIATHAPPYRRLWMGPQFTFYIYQGSNYNLAAPLTLPSLEVDRTASSSSSSSSLSKQNISDDLNHDLKFSRQPCKSQAKDFRAFQERRDSGSYFDQSCRGSPILRATSNEEIEAEEQLRANLAEAISDETSTEFFFNQDLLDNIDLQECDESEGSDAWAGCFGEKGRGLSVSPSRSSDSN